MTKKVLQAIRKENNLFRKHFGLKSDLDQVPDLVVLQKDSYRKFLQADIDPLKRENTGIQAVFNSYFPFFDNNSKITIEFVNYNLKAPKFESKECFSAGRTFSSSLTVKLRMILWSSFDDNINNREVKSIKEQEVYLCEIPLMTENGSFIVNGVERVVVSQMRRSPGVFFDSEHVKISGSKTYTAKIVPNLGSWIDFEFDSKDVLNFRIDKKKKIPTSSLFRALGMSSTEIMKTFYGSIDALVTKNGWAIPFDFDSIIGKKAVFDFICSKTNEIIIKSGSKITKKTAEKLIQEKVDSYLITEDVIAGYVLAEDIFDNDTGELLVEAGSVTNLENLTAFEKLRFKKISIANPGKSMIGPYIYNTMISDRNQNEKDALYEIYKSVRMGESPSSLEVAKSYFESIFLKGDRYDLSDVGRMKMNHRLSLDINENNIYVTLEDIIKIVKILSEIKHNDLKTDDIDNLGNRRVRAVGELIENQLRIGMLRVEKAASEKINSVDADSIMPQNIINSKPLITAIKDFFATSQLSQFMDQTNPLSEVTHKRRLSALGPGGITRDRAGFEVRDVHPTHYGRICPIETPEGQNIGLINSLATYAQVNKYGFIETPYRKVINGHVTDDLVYLSSIEEVGYAIAPATIEVDKNGKIISELCSCRKDGEFIMLPYDKIDFIDASTKQIVSVATTLIPFIENDDANRALMGSNMQRQAVPLLRPEAPLVGTGMESIIASDSGAAVVAKRSGNVVFVDSTQIVINSSAESEINIDYYNLIKYKRTNQDTCINQHPIVKVGDSISAGQIISDAHSIDDGEIALGKNVRVAFMPWSGYNFEDSIIISEKLLANDTFTSLHIEELEVVARDTRIGPEEITRDIPNVSEEALMKLDEEGIIHIGAKIKPGDIIVGKTTPKSESPMTPEEKLLKVIFGEKATDVRDSSLYASASVSGTVVDVKVFSRKGVEKDERTISIEMQEIEKLSKRKNLQIFFIEKMLKEQLVNLIEGQKITNSPDKLKAKKPSLNDLLDLSIANLMKITVESSSAMNQIESLIKSFEQKCYDIEQDFSNKIAKIKSGDDLGQGVLKVIKVYVASKYRLQPGDKMAGRHGNKGVVSKIAPIEDMPFSADGEPVDIILNPIGVPSRMNIGQILETHLGLASKELGKQIGKIIDKCQEEKIVAVEELRVKLLGIYNNPKEIEKIRNMSDDQLLHFACRLKKGVPFATGTFEGAREEHVTGLLDIAGLDNSGQIDLYDGRTGDKFDRKVTVGYIYMLKLHHLVDDKIHARSIGPYSLITQQPLGGKSHFGGQRFGEMECWALQAYGAAYSLQEMLTVKSDDVVGRIKIYEAIIQGNQNFNCGISESFNVMIKEVRSLGLNIELIEI